MRGFSSIGLHRPKDHLNVGEVLRAAGCYSAALVAVSGARYKKARTDTQLAHRHLPLVQCDDLQSVVPFGSTPVAIDIIEGAQPLQEFVHPTSAFYVFGPEDGTLDAGVLEWCEHIVYIPTRYCMNLAATVNVVLYDRLMKQLTRPSIERILVST